MVSLYEQPDGTIDKAQEPKTWEELTDAQRAWWEDGSGWAMSAGRVRLVSISKGWHSDPSEEEAEEWFSRKRAREAGEAFVDEAVKYEKSKGYDFGKPKFTETKGYSGA